MQHNSARMFANGNIGAYTNSSPWPSQAGGMVTNNMVRLPGPQFDGYRTTSNPMSTMGSGYNVVAPPFGQFPPASVANVDVVGTGPFPTPTIFVRPDFTLLSTSHNVAEEWHHLEDLIELCFYNAETSQPPREMDLVHQRASVCNFCSVPKMVSNAVLQGSVNCCVIGITRQIKRLPTIQFKRNRIGDSKNKDNFGVSIQHSGLSRCANLFLKTNEMALIKPGCPVHIVMTPNGEFYGVVNNGDTPKPKVDKPESPDSVRDIIHVVTANEDMPEMKRAFVGFVVHGEKPRSSIRKNSSIKQLCDKIRESKSKGPHMDSISILLCCDRDNEFR